jgi:hypothetical protein
LRKNIKTNCYVHNKTGDTAVLRLVICLSQVSINAPKLLPEMRFHLGLT